jgi:hypothetical protein
MSLVTFTDGVRVSDPIWVPRGAEIRCGQSTVKADGDKVIVWDSVWTINGLDRKPPAMYPPDQMPCPNPFEQPFSAQTLPVKIGIVLIMAALLGTAVLGVGWLWKHAIEVWQ